MSGFFVLSALKKYLGPVSFFFFVFVMQNPVITFPMLEVSPPGGIGVRGLDVMGLWGARLVGSTCTLTEQSQ